MSSNARKRSISFARRAHILSSSLFSFSKLCCVVV